MAEDKLSKWFEKMLHGVGEDMQSEVPVMWHRYPDSYAAMGHLPTQPGDFHLLTPRGCLLIEAKSSQVHRSLTSGLSSMVDPAQIGHHTLWLRAKQPTIFMFLSEPEWQIEVWHGSPVVEAVAQGKKLELSKRLTVIQPHRTYVRDVFQAYFEGELL